MTRGLLWDLGETRRHAQIVELTMNTESGKAMIAFAIRFYWKHNPVLIIAFKSRLVHSRPASHQVRLPNSVAMHYHVLTARALFLYRPSRGLESIP